MTNCTHCILDGTDACPRGAGRAVDDEVCEEFIEEGAGMNTYERHIFNGKCPFTDKPCDKDIDCIECKINHEEKTLFDDEGKEQE